MTVDTLGISSKAAIAPKQMFSFTTFRNEVETRQSVLLMFPRGQITH